MQKSDFHMTNFLWNEQPFLHGSCGIQISTWAMWKSDFWSLVQVVISRIFWKCMKIYQWPSLILTHTGISIYKKKIRYKKFETSYHINLGRAAPKLVDLAFFPHAQLFVDDCQLILSHGSSFFPSCAAFCWCLSADYITRSNLIGSTRTFNLPSTIMPWLSSIDGAQYG